MAYCDAPGMGLTEISEAFDKCLSNIQAYRKHEKFEIKKVIFHDPATVVLWADGTKTVVKCQPGDTYDREKGFLLAVCKKVYGNTGKYNSIIHRHLDCESAEIKTETAGLSVQCMRQDLDGFCHRQWCTKCPLGGPVCRCGRGAHFLTTRNGKYTMTDGEIRDAYRIAFGPKQGGNK